MSEQTKEEVDRRAAANLRCVIAIPPQPKRTPAEVDRLMFGKLFAHGQI